MRRAAAQAVLPNTGFRPWEMLSLLAKETARGWFVKRAEEKGIPWNESVEKFAAQQRELDSLYKELLDPEVEYPAYYTQAFHGYDEGNLCWRAAHELEAATCSMCLSYYDGLSWQEAQDRFRGAAAGALAEYWSSARDGARREELPRSLLDIGCSGGFSTEQMAQAFPGVEATGLDLSPYFLAAAQLAYPHLRFRHGNAESTKFPDGSFDVVTLNFLLHELPLAASVEVLQEARRILRPGGVLAVLDVDPRRLMGLPPFRRWAFQVTEPWCKEGEYYSLDLPAELERAGFCGVQQKSNDPVNSLVVATRA